VLKIINFGGRTLYIIVFHLKNFIGLFAINDYILSANFKTNPTSFSSPKFVRIYVKNFHINQNDMWKYLTIGWHFFNSIIGCKGIVRNFFWKQKIFQKGAWAKMLIFNDSCVIYGRSCAIGTVWMWFFIIKTSFYTGFLDYFLYFLGECWKSGVFFGVKCAIILAVIHVPYAGFWIIQKQHIYPA